MLFDPVFSIIIFESKNNTKLKYHFVCRSVMEYKEALTRTTC